VATKGGTKHREKRDRLQEKKVIFTATVRIRLGEVSDPKRRENDVSRKEETQDVRGGGKKMLLLADREKEKARVGGKKKPMLSKKGPELLGQEKKAPLKEKKKIQLPRPGKKGPPSSRRQEKKRHLSLPQRKRGKAVQLGKERKGGEGRFKKRKQSIFLVRKKVAGQKRARNIWKSLEKRNTPKKKKRERGKIEGAIRGEKKDPVTSPEKNRKVNVLSKRLVSTLQERRVYGNTRSGTIGEKKNELGEEEKKRKNAR